MSRKAPRLFIVVGNPASGKDELIAAVNIIGSMHAEIVPKHTDRPWRVGDDVEMICSDGPNAQEFDLENCDVSYTNYGTVYGIKSAYIWEKLRNGISQVLVVSNRDALNKLKRMFGDLAVFIYVYAPITSNQYRAIEEKKQQEKMKKDPNYKINQSYIDERVYGFDMAWKLYEDNFMLFDHVFIYADKREDLFDQIFRLFRAYET